MILDHFNVLILKKIILIYFQVKIILKSNRYQSTTRSNIFYNSICFCVLKNN
jgi:hypothetical protein